MRELMDDNLGSERQHLVLHFEIEQELGSLPILPAQPQTDLREASEQRTKQSCGVCEEVERAL